MSKLCDVLRSVRLWSNSDDCGLWILVCLFEEIRSTSHQANPNFLPWARLTSCVKTTSHSCMYVSFYWNDVLSRSRILSRFSFHNLRRDSSEQLHPRLNCYTWRLIFGMDREQPEWASRKYTDTVGTELFLHHMSHTFPSCYRKA
jgi:hypothetical protein